MTSVIVRRFVREDSAALIGLMRELAIFEGYIDAFSVTEADLIAHGLAPDPLFGALVAMDPNRPDLLGMAVHYVIPWTYDLKPTLVLKELYVTAPARGSGVGTALMRAVAGEAVRIGAARIIWGVLSGNRPAERFYSALGAARDHKFEPWSLDGAAIAALAQASIPGAAGPSRYRRRAPSG